MHESTPLTWPLIVVLAGTAVWFLFRGMRPGPGGAERITHLAHVLMAAAMLAMIWPMA